MPDKYQSSYYLTLIVIDIVGLIWYMLNGQNPAFCPVCLYLSALTETRWYSCQNTRTGGHEMENVMHKHNAKDSRAFSCILGHTHTHTIMHANNFKILATYLQAAIWGYVITFHYGDIHTVSELEKGNVCCCVCVRVFVCVIFCSIDPQRFICGCV